MPSEDLWPNPEILGVQSRLYSPGYVGPARWVLFEPRARRAFSALGKDVVPDAVAVLAEAAGGVPRAQLLQRHEHVTPRNLDSLVDSRLLTTRPATASEPTGIAARSPSVLATFHAANVDYPFFDYGSPSVIEDEAELLDHYSRLWPAPPAILVRTGRRYALPPANREQDRELTLSPSSLGWLLKTVLRPVGEIGTRHVTCIRRTVPSGGARHPTELVMVLRRPLAEVPAGAYSYDVAAHALVAEPAEVQQAYAAGVPDGGFGIVVRSRVERAMWRYRDLRALRPVLIDAGHVVEMVTFLLARLGIAAEVVSAAGAAPGESWLDEPEVVLIRPIATGAECSEHPPTDPLAADQGAVLTNPALALRFGPQLAADVLWPASRSVPIGLTDFLVLNHCLPSTRGDRDTSARGVVEAVPGATEASIQRLRDVGALLSVRDAQSLYGGSRLWVRHEWYMALLAYLEARSHGRAAPVASLVPPDGTYLDDLGAIQRRRTTRFFASTALAADSVEALLSRVFADGPHVGVAVSLAIWQVSGLATGLYRWQNGQLKRVGDAPERAAVTTTSAGQTATSTGALALWISSLTDPGQPARYVMDLVDLGRLGQRVCLAGAELGIGVFLTPAVHDRGACSLLGLADAERRLTYVFGLGVRATP